MASPLSSPFTSAATWLRPALFASALVATIGTGSAQSNLSKDSPFVPGAATTPAATNETIEFAGVSTVGSKTDLRIYDKTTKRSRWIPVGQTVDGIAALKYDSKLEQAVVRVNGTEKTLTLRRGTGPVNAPSAIPALGYPTVAPVPAPAPAANSTQPAMTMPLPAPPAAAPVDPSAAPVPPPTPETVAKQETEARMLVSDLLEIGMAQRKAYEEAQRKAAEQNGTLAPAPTPPPAPVAPATPAPSEPAK